MISMTAENISRKFHKGICHHKHMVCSNYALQAFKFLYGEISLKALKILAKDIIV
ncbi:MAG: hypothetical protein PWR27_1765 [Petroclostridium sp.]|jgi:hypothetical protein|nr:hypothetical protein [Clostridia bacterium]MDK2811056.1 hypothetical protein [Petroclostridium sp.]